MFLKINFTDDEVEMLNGWSGQMSDGVGENKRWCNDYWQGLDFSNDGISVDETKRAFKNKSEEYVKEDILNRFIEITDEGMDYLGISDLYFDGAKRDDIILGEKTANSIIEKLGGVDYKDYYDL